MPILASFSRLIYYSEPYISKFIKVFYHENFERPTFGMMLFQRHPFEIILDLISIIFILFALLTSFELLIMPCTCLNKDLKITISKRGLYQNERYQTRELDSFNELDILGVEEDGNKRNKSQLQLQLQSLELSKKQPLERSKSQLQSKLKNPENN